MKICVIGGGYVGLATAACLANLGNDVVCVEKSKSKLSSLKKGKIPFYETGLDVLIASNLNDRRLSFTNSINKAVKESDVIFITVGTPPKEDGSADLSGLRDVAMKIAKVLLEMGSSSKTHKIIGVKSTVPVGTCEMIVKMFKSNKVPASMVSVVSNPEFLREGSAVYDFMHPDRIVIGATNNRAFNSMSELYRPINAHIIFMDPRSAELVKYVSNCFLATKISFVNEIANICDKLGVDVTEITNSVGLDKRIGRSFFNAGIGYGGSCLPKDISALIHLSRSKGYEPKLLGSVSEVNGSQAGYFINKIVAELGGIKGKRIAILGVTFKPETDDLRESPALKLIKILKKAGARITAYDPVHKGKMIEGVKVKTEVYSALRGSEAVVVCTEWPEFRQLDFKKVMRIMKTPIFCDGRNIYDPRFMKELGFSYTGIGR